MNPKCILGKAINHGPEKGLGFDAFGACPEQGLYALCDGANSCPDSGQAALWLCHQITHTPMHEDKPLNFEPLVRDLHEDMLLSFPNTAATLVGLHVAPWGMRLVSVGDSDLTLFKRRWRGWGSWQKNCTMPKDLDTDGNPSQLIASLQKTLQKISHQTPSSEDLDYLCRALADEALSSGCQDDVSVAMLWIRYG
jgi:hypothetical protein